MAVGGGGGQSVGGGMFFRDKEPTDEVEEWAGEVGGSVIHMQRRRPLCITPTPRLNPGRAGGELMKRAGRPN